MMEKLVAAVMIMTMAVGMTACGGGSFDLDKEINQAAEWVMEAFPSPGVGSVGGDWAVKGVSASGIENDSLGEYFERYYDDVRVNTKQSEGIIDEFYYTGNARVVIGVESVGKDSTDVEGYNLVEPLDNYKKVTDQGINAAAYALIASNVADADLENEENYIKFILDEAESNKLYEKTDKADYAAIVIEGLSFYDDREEVKEMIEKCIGCLSEAQLEDGSLGNCESTAEAIMALTCAGVDQMSDERFVKDGKTLIDGLMLYKAKDGYLHMADDEETDYMSAEKALLALSSVKLLQQGETLY